MTNTSSPSISPDRLAGAIYGLAYGDAIGAPVEFDRYETIMASGGVSIPPLFRVTDDTQMSLAVWYALDSWDERSLGSLRLELMSSFLAYRVDPDNDRAPGVTVMSSLGVLSRVGFGSWVLASDPSSSGCGSVMRAPWIGLHSKLSDEQVSRVAMMQAVLTHAPAENAFCAAALADLTRAVARGEVVSGEAAAWLVAWADEHENDIYDEVALGDVHRVVRVWGAPADAPAGQLPAEYVADGLASVRWVAERVGALSRALTEDFWGFDPADISGEGWRAREAVAMAVGIFDAVEAFYDTSGPVCVVPALIRAVETSGDSDSVAAIAGALVGAAFGRSAFPVWWRGRLEPRYEAELSAVVAG